jgi:hypothetical protein
VAEVANSDGVDRGVEEEEGNWLIVGEEGELPVVVERTICAFLRFSCSFKGRMRTATLIALLSISWLFDGYLLLLLLLFGCWGKEGILSVCVRSGGGTSQSDHSLVLLMIKFL